MGPEVLKVIENDRKHGKSLKTNEVKKAIMGSRVLKIIENLRPFMGSRHRKSMAITLTLYGVKGTEHH